MKDFPQKTDTRKQQRHRLTRFHGAERRLRSAVLYAALVVAIFVAARSMNLSSHLDWRISAFGCFVLALLPAYGLHRALRSVLALGLSPFFLEIDGPRLTVHSKRGKRRAQVDLDEPHGAHLVAGSRGEDLIVTLGPTGPLRLVGTSEGTNALPGAVTHTSVRLFHPRPGDKHAPYRIDHPGMDALLAALEAHRSNDTEPGRLHLGAEYRAVEIGDEAMTLVLEGGERVEYLAEEPYHWTVRAVPRQSRQRTDDMPDYAQVTLVLQAERRLPLIFTFPGPAALLGTLGRGWTGDRINLPPGFIEERGINLSPFTWSNLEVLHLAALLGQILARNGAPDTLVSALQEPHELRFVAR